jgi:hypothetical protein
MNTAENRVEPSKVQRRVFNFFKRTQGVDSLAPIYNKAAAIYGSSVGQEEALYLYYKTCVEDERLRAADVGEEVSQEEASAIHDLSQMQSL